ncbi:serine carboxypeptidase-like 7 [Cornus florida]|uniref:serine carboxypeptidase-like 7 n=1 Tax=Cornus florida TaxID=4283 RepID=UPI002898DC37|nr:serine carboxypeptidase-like 7 [Cornus florida]
MALKATTHRLSKSNWFDYYSKGPRTTCTWVCLHLFFQLLFSGIAASHTIVTSLPGFSGDLPFTLETGYISVGELDDVQLFYYFVQSQRSPAQDPLMMWLTGGPGCSGLAALFYESGPLNFNYENYNGSAPTLSLNDYAWTQALNMIYIDAPVGTGFSYSTTAEGYISNDSKTVAHLYQFLGKWLLDHTDFASNNIYIGGESYSGVTVPMLVQEISDGIKAGHYPSMNIRGYVLVNPKTDSFIDNNERIPYAYGMSLISKEIYEATKESCNGDYVNTDSSSEDCLSDLAIIEELLSEINLLQILEPSCSAISLESRKTKGNRRFLREESKNVILSQPRSSANWCRDYTYIPLGVWANEIAVQEALNVRNGTVEFWTKCNSSIEYTNDVTSTIEYHRNLTSTGLRALIFSGDHDLSIPSIATQEWIASLNITLEQSWRSWSNNGQTAGYTKKYSSGDFSLTYATVKGAGHIAPEYKPEECYVMMDRWLAYYPL